MIVGIASKVIRAFKDPSLISAKINSRFIERQKARLDLESERARSYEFLNRHFNVDALALHRAYLTSDYKAWFDARRTELTKLGGKGGTTSQFDLETLYLLVRALRPAIVVETGVLYGASSSHILQALKENGSGNLYSIDLPPSQAGLPQDYFVRDDLRHWWTLTNGDSKLELQPLLDGLGSVDLFHHDSLHTYNHMIWEYGVALEHLSIGGVISSHDVRSLNSRRNVFENFSSQHDLDHGVFRNVGIAVNTRVRAHA